MQFTAKMFRRFPNACSHLNAEVPRLQYRKKAWKAFQKWGEFSEEEAVDAISLGKPPTLEPRHIPWSGSGNRLHARYDPSSAGARNDVIFVGVHVLVWYEDSLFNRADLSLQSFMTRLIWHETLHWGDAGDGKQQKTKAGKLVEEGEAWELEVFGGQNGWKEVWDQWVWTEWLMRNPPHLGH